MYYIYFVVSMWINRINHTHTHPRHSSFIFVQFSIIRLENTIVNPLIRMNHHQKCEARGIHTHAKNFHSKWWNKRRKKNRMMIENWIADVLLFVQLIPKMLQPHLFPIGFMSVSFAFSHSVILLSFCNESLLALPFSVLYVFFVFRFIPNVCCVLHYCYTSNVMFLRVFHVSCAEIQLWINRRETFYWQDSMYTKSVCFRHIRIISQFDSVKNLYGFVFFLSFVILDWICETSGITAKSRCGLHI